MILHERSGDWVWSVPRNGRGFERRVPTWSGSAPWVEGPGGAWLNRDSRQACMAICKA